MRIIAFIFIFITQASLFASNSCDDWFKDLKIKRDKSCLSKCNTSETDMATYMCKNKCVELCRNKEIIDTKEVEQNFYGLTDDEIKFCELNKLICIKAYKSSWTAEQACKQIYPASDNKDESDACRHYVWSILLAQDFGEKTAMTILSAHENNPSQPSDDKEMDIHNNQVGMDDFKNKKISFKKQEDILGRYKENLKAKKFIIIKPFYEKTGGLP